MRLSPFGTSVTIWPTVPERRMIDNKECGEVSGMRNGKGKHSSRRRHAPVPLCSPQIPHDLTRAQNRPVAVGSWINCVSYGAASIVRYCGSL
jgi:hypothetical protein